MSELRRRVLERFLRYVQIDTQSEENSTTYPSTEKQFNLLRPLVEELKAIGLADAAIDEWGYVMATIPATTKKANERRLPLGDDRPHVRCAAKRTQTRVVWLSSRRILLPAGAFF